MVEAAPTYDLTLLLSLNASDEQRAKVLSDVETSIGASGGALVNNADWGRRPTAYQIDHQAEAEYHLLQFNAPAPMIEELSHTLRITDGVLRFRVIKLRPGTPAAPSSPPPVVVAAAPTSGASAAGASATAPAEAPAAAAAPAEAPAVEAPSPDAPAAEAPAPEAPLAEAPAAEAPATEPAPAASPEAGADAETPAAE